MIFQAPIFTKKKPDKNLLYRAKKKKESIHFCNCNHFLIRTKMLSSMFNIIHHYRQLWIKLKLQKLLKRDPAGDRLSTSVKTSC